MKHILSTIAALVLVGCGEVEAERALFEAAAVGNIEAVKKHLAAGTDVNAKNEKGMTPLMQAAWGGHNEITKLLNEISSADLQISDLQTSQSSLEEIFVSLI